MAISIVPRPAHVTHYGGRYDETVCPLTYRADPSLPAEGYRITLRADGGEAAYADDGGRFYAAQTLRQLRAPDGTYPCVCIEDAPRYPYRAFMVDSARHMQSVAQLKTLIEAAALLKFNRFHWHLTDDQGWRMESQSFPRLNEISAWRACDGFLNDDGVRYGGYYTREEIRGIVAFCAERQITVIPEIDMPGHMVALLAAYPDLSCTGRVTAVSTHAGIHKDVLCVGKDATFQMMTRLLDEVCDLFPGEWVHIGGDEVPPQRWQNCEDCRARMRRLGVTDPAALHSDFINRIAAYLKAKGRRAVTWNDTLKGGDLDRDVVVCNWMDKTGRCIDRANSGGLVIEEDFFHYYLDYPYGMTPLRKTYGFDPMRAGLTEIGRANVIGVETPIWTEFVRDFKQLCFMCFPRMLAVAERGWTPPQLLNGKDFAARARALLPLLQTIGITAAPPKTWDPRALGRWKGLAQHYCRVLRVAHENRGVEEA
ncbi:MAG: beta-N-acetylhexosaminidase [Clostridia bacterium]|nr:beta-N-acetylhexosaminidase [Clostridia bacterium]